MPDIPSRKKVINNRREYIKRAIEYCEHSSNVAPGPNSMVRHPQALFYHAEERKEKEIHIPAHGLLHLIARGEQKRPDNCYRDGI